MTSPRTAVSLADHTSLRLGGPAQRFVSATTSAEVAEQVRGLDAEGTPVLVLGGGSNLVIADEGFGGTVVQLGNTGWQLGADGELVVESGTNFDELVAFTVDAGLSGIETLSGIPGLVGATPVQNVGAYGSEIAETLVGVELLHRASGEVRTVSAAELGLAYRTSVLKNTDSAVVLRVHLRLRPSAHSEPVRYAELARTLGVAVGDSAPLADVRSAVLELRRGKGMVLDRADNDTWSAGSFFTNPMVAEDVLAGYQGPRYPGEDGKVKLSAAWLIEHAGFPKGYAGPGGRVALSSKHTLALTNRGSATTADLLALAAEVRSGVHSAFGVTLHHEPVLVGCTL